MKKMLSLAMLAGMVATLLAATPASAVPLPSPIVASVNATYAKGTCRYTPTSIKAGSVRGYVGYNAQTTFAGYKANVKGISFG